MTRRAAFLDRDGVINLDRGYVYRWEDFAFVPGAVDAMRRLQDAGYALLVVTNQSGIARGYYDEASLLGLHEALRAHLADQGVQLAAIEYCPHLPGAPLARYAIDCDCRKPAPGMILRAARALDLDLAASLMFGDKPSDIEAAQRAGVGRAVLVATDARPEAAKGESPEFASLAAAVDALLP
ncbi:MAG TPA: D-glycero-beta-D-manno-heptose 1,7-bisphosphate 7-phosphatase [Roseateles sp.]